MASSPILCECNIGTRACYMLVPWQRGNSNSTTYGKTIEIDKISISRIMRTITAGFVHLQKPAIRMASTMSEHFSFSALEPTPSALGPRLGSLALKGRTPLRTPHYIALSSRGAVPHISQDMVRKHTDIKGVHAALEDCKRRTPEASLNSDTDMPAPIGAR